MKLRKLRIAFSAACGIICLLLIVLWVRSRHAEDRASGRLSSIGIRLYSSRGWLVLFKNSTPGAGPYEWDITLSSDYWLAENDSRLKFTSPAHFFSGSATSNISMPHWLMIVFASSMAAVPWIRWRFSLRTLLFAMTLVAVVLGVII